MHRETSLSLPPARNRIAAVRARRRLSLGLCASAAGLVWAFVRSWGLASPLAAPGMSMTQSLLHHLNLREQLFGLHVHSHDSSSVVHYEPADPYKFLDTWPQNVDAAHPESCSYRVRAKMQKTLNHLTVRLGIDVPNVKRQPDLRSRVGFELVAKEQPQHELDAFRHAASSFRGLPRVHQAHLDEYLMLEGMLSRCTALFGELHAMGSSQDRIVSSQHGFSELFNQIHAAEEESEEEEQTQ